MVEPPPLSPPDDFTACENRLNTNTDDGSTVPSVGNRSVGPLGEMFRVDDATTGSFTRPSSAGPNGLVRLDAGTCCEFWADGLFGSVPAVPKAVIPPGSETSSRCAGV